MTSNRPKHRQARPEHHQGIEPEKAPCSLESQRDQSASAAMEKTALSNATNDLMESFVDPDNLETAWRNVKGNRGAPGPDGVTIEQFPETIREQWPEIRQQLLEGTYQPGAARRKSIPKPDGSERHLGIPNVIDRLIQQAILQVLTPIFDAGFSESSYGFRPKRSAHGAVKQIQATIRSGYRHCVDMDLSKFFDRVQHDVLLARVSRKVHDKRLLKLIGRYLRAGVMVEGIHQATPEGTMQGGPLSPLLANILLDDFDKLLESRGLHFVRYADDFLVFTKTATAAERVYQSVERYLTRKLKLVVNHQKSRVCSTNGVEFLGYQFHGYSGQIRISPKKLAKLNERIHEILSRNRGMSMTSRLSELRLYLRGWIGYFALEQRKTILLDLDKRIRRLIRACYWKSWRLPRTRISKLIALGISKADAMTFGNSRKGFMRMALTSALQRGLSNSHLANLGLFNLTDRWSVLAPLRRTA
jgi:RNA-directed DNA polymerase